MVELHQLTAENESDLERLRLTRPDFVKRIGRIAAGLAMTGRFRAMTGDELAAAPMPTEDLLAAATARWAKTDSTVQLQSALAHVPLSDVGSVVSLCCGAESTLAGDTAALRCLGLPDTARVTGIDVYARPSPTADLRREAASATSLADSSIALAYLCNGLCNSAEAPKIAGEIVRVLSPSGFAVVAQNFDLHLVLEVAHQLRASGCRVVAYEPTTAHVVVQKAARIGEETAALPALPPPRVLYETNAGFTVTYEIDVPAAAASNDFEDGHPGGTYPGSTCTAGIGLSGDLSALVGDYLRARGASHHKQLSEGTHHARKLQRACDAVRAQGGVCSEWSPIPDASDFKMAIGHNHPAIGHSADGTTTIHVGPHLTLHATPIPYGQRVPFAKLLMLQREQRLIFSCAEAGNWLGTSALAGMPDAACCAKGGSCGGPDDYRVLEALEGLRQAEDLREARAGRGSAADAAATAAVEAAKAALDVAKEQQQQTSELKAAGGAAGGPRDPRLVRAEAQLQQAVAQRAAAAPGEQKEKADAAVAVGEAAVAGAQKKRQSTSQGKASGYATAVQCDKGGVERRQQVNR